VILSTAAVICLELFSYMWIIPIDVAMEKLPSVTITRTESSDYGGCHKFIPN